MWFIFVYIFIGWYKKYKLKINLAIELGLFITMIGLFVLPSIAMIWTNSPFLNNLCKWTTQWCNDFKSLPNFLLSIVIFAFFERLNIGVNKCINVIAAGCSGVYIIHQIHGFEMIIWNDIFKIPYWKDDKDAVLLLLMTVMAVFASASLIDYIRRHTLEKMWKKSRLYGFLNFVGNEVIMGGQ